VFREDTESTGSLLQAVFGEKQKMDRPLSLYVTGTNFQISVWKALLQIPPGKVSSYSQIASAIGQPRAARAVGTANGQNPIAFLIPCHRVILQSGKIGDYHWGETRKQAIHAWEAARYEN
jgi:AraC family transcriptional regulator of adaptative response/methylated-DNA-[protein]-cysteine methyltransferase